MALMTNRELSVSPERRENNMIAEATTCNEIIAVREDSK